MTEGEWRRSALIPNYGKIIPLDKGKYTQGLFDGEVVVQEKVDGSQVSFAMECVSAERHIGGKRTYAPVVRSKNQIVQDGNKMFQMVLDWVRDKAPRLNPNFIYRGEAVTSLKHNTLTYARVPNGGVMLFDIYDREGDRMLDPSELRIEAVRLGLEQVRTFAWRKGVTIEDVRSFIGSQSKLGGTFIEGVVIKAYDKPDPQSFAQTTDAQGFLKVKLVCEDFKEVHHKDWKGRNPNGKDFVSNLVEVYGTPQRFDKAIQRMREEGKLTETPKDIGELIGRVVDDIKEECADEIAAALFKHFGKKVLSGIGKKVPNYYKETVLGLEIA
jgi:hypothetical protein